MFEQHMQHHLGSDVSLRGFADFFFVCYTYGCKIPYTPTTAFVGMKAAFRDIDLDNIRKQDIYLDLATNLTSNLDGYTYIWRSTTKDSKDWSDILEVLFPHTQLIREGYRHDIFGQVLSFEEHVDACFSSTTLAEIVDLHFNRRISFNGGEQHYFNVDICIHHTRN